MSIKIWDIVKWPYVWVREWYSQYRNLQRSKQAKWKQSLLRNGLNILIVTVYWLFSRKFWLKKLLTLLGLGYCDCDGSCVCNYEKDRQISGKYCEFDSDRCLKGENGLTCSGNGECQPDYTCKCSEGWTGDACGCSEKQDQCQGVDGLGMLL